MRIAYITTYDAKSIGGGPGMGYHIAKSLEAQSIWIECVGPLTEKDSLLVKAKRCLYGRLLGKRYLPDREPIVLRNYARQVAEKLSSLDVDLVFSPGTIPIAYLRCEHPIVFWTDATFGGMIDFYPGFSGLCSESIADGNTVESLALSRSSLAIYSSEWAAQTAVENYHVQRSKVKVVPFGPYLKCDRTFDDVRRLVYERATDVCRLLFFGREWRRKGGDIALEVTRELNEMGLPTELMIAGTDGPTCEKLPEFAASLGYLDKSTDEGLDTIQSLLARSHFLILPTRADCAPAAIREASAFGLPSVTTDVGGISTLVRDGANGRIFPADASISAYCEYISDLMSNYPSYRDLALSTFEEYKVRLNWSVAGQTVKRLLMDVVAGS
jgi:glycosyltransferase involved in cell wall biosynthesis